MLKIAMLVKITNALQMFPHALPNVDESECSR
jgi:hypothetical protein